MKEKALWALLGLSMMSSVVSALLGWRQGRAQLQKTAEDYEVHIGQANQMTQQVAAKCEHVIQQMDLAHESEAAELKRCRGLVLKCSEKLGAEPK
ncbi:MAG: hypothetical protein ACRD68_00085 [Pyrinomonadaceae bacterium]